MDQYNQDNKINVLEILMDIQKDVSSLNTNVNSFRKALDDNSKKLDNVDKKASKALNMSKENSKDIESQNNNGKQESDHRIQYITTLIGAIAGPIAVTIIMKLFHM